jgi:hypothetical protein
MGTKLKTLTKHFIHEMVCGERILYVRLELRTYGSSCSVGSLNG